MHDKKEITKMVFEVIDDINELLPEEQQLKKHSNTVLFGKLGKLDSLGLVNLIVATEQKIEEKFNITITLADERAISKKHSPFNTIESFVNYIFLLLKGNINEK